MLVVQSFDELDAAGDRVKGKIVLFNVPFTNYGETVQYRGSRRRRARPRSAPSAMLVRAGRTLRACARRTPARSRYADGAPQIPAAAITTEDADRLQRMQDRGHDDRASGSRWKRSSCPTPIRRTSSARSADASSPRRSSSLGGHFDSWDVGTGSTDDGGGCVVTWEALRLMKKLEPAAAPNRARGALHERRERRSRRASPIASGTRANSPIT